MSIANQKISTTHFAEILSTSQRDAYAMAAIPLQLGSEIAPKIVNGPKTFFAAANYSIKITDPNLMKPNISCHLSKEGFSK
jgi:hypothetical protein